MQYKKVVKVFFSPRGTTLRLLDGACAPLALPDERLDLLRQPLQSRCDLPADAVLAVAMPVYAGRIPPYVLDSLSLLHGSGPALALVSYGNRHYDDALLELCDLLQAQGFAVPAAGAFVAQHSIFSQVAQGRPDLDDLAQLKAFGEAFAALLQAGPLPAAPPAVPGKRPYCPYSPVPLQPDGDRRCNACNACVAVCPTRAIVAEEPRLTDATRCISCGACIHVCPTGARGYHGMAYKLAGKVFAKKCAARRSPECFYAQSDAAEPAATADWAAVAE